VLPLQNYLSDKTAWISGIRSSKGDLRSQADLFKWDAKNEIVKINPLISLTAEQVWVHIHTHNLPYNPLHDDGYPSIGCISCTSKVTGNYPERTGRWKDIEKTECGIHFPKHGMS